MNQNKHHLKKHVKHHKHRHEKTVSVGRGGLYVPGNNWWGPMMCGVGLCSGTGGGQGDHEHDESQEQENQEHGDGAVEAGGEAGESGAVTVSGGGDSSAAGM
jgi:hypothetical protein